MLSSSANLSKPIDISISLEIFPPVVQITLEPNKMRLSGKENVQCYLSYTVVQCFPNPFPGSGSSANHKTTESVQAIRESKFPVYSFLHFPRPHTMLSKTFHKSVGKLKLESLFP